MVDSLNVDANPELPCDVILVLAASKPRASNIAWSTSLVIVDDTGLVHKSHVTASLLFQSEYVSWEILAVYRGQSATTVTSMAEVRLLLHYAIMGSNAASLLHVESIKMLNQMNEYCCFRN